VSVMCGRSLFCQLCVTGHWFVSYVCKVSGLSVMCVRSVVCLIDGLSVMCVRLVVCLIDGLSGMCVRLVVGQLYMTYQWFVSLV
jgi:hypothetical protein